MMQRIIRKWKANQQQKKQSSNGCNPTPTSKDEKPVHLSTTLSTNLRLFHDTLGNSSDVKIHEFAFGNTHPIRAALIFIDGLVSSEILTESILKPLTMNFPQMEIPRTHALLDAVRQRILCTADVTENEYENQLVQKCLSGDTVLLIDGFARGLIISSKGWEKRSVTEPQTESVARGPREGFTENFRTNTSLIRRKIRNPALRMDEMIIGEKTQTLVSVIYLKGVADPHLIQCIKDRLKSIHVDSILESGYIEQYIEDAPLSIFSTVGKSEKPDVIAAKILEGRAAIVVDGTPFVLTAPMMFLESFQTSEDYYSRTIYASIIRLLRFVTFFLSVYAPALYVAITTFHQEFIPTTLLFTIAQAREGTPFPAFLEALILLLAFEILREAGLRLPRPIGQAVSIVGALVMGDAAVSAGVVGAPMVITIAITAMSEFVTPESEDAMAILRVIFLACSAILGGYGIALASLAFLIHLSSLESFGVPYLTGIAPASSHAMEDAFIRAPLWSMVKRPYPLSHRDTTRRKYMKPPVPQPKENPHADKS